MTKDETSLLLYLETRAVDHAGVVNAAHMNNDDLAIAKRWNNEGFVEFGRIASQDLGRFRGACHWCHLSDAAFQAAHEARKAKADRVWAKRDFAKTEEVHSKS